MPTWMIWLIATAIIATVTIAMGWVAAVPIILALVIITIVVGVQSNIHYNEDCSVCRKKRY